VERFFNVTETNTGCNTRYKSQSRWPELAEMLYRAILGRDNDDNTINIVSGGAEWTSTYNNVSGDTYGRATVRNYTSSQEFNNIISRYGIGR